MKLTELFDAELKAGIPIYLGGRTEVDYSGLDEPGKKSVQLCATDQAKLIDRISPKLAEDYRAHLPVFLKCAGIARALFPGNKPVEYPSRVGAIGVAGLVPQVIKYATTASDTYPCYTNYPTNSWELSLTAGDKVYILGDGTNFYKASPTANKHSLLVVIKDGLVEVGTTPKIVQQRIWTAVDSRLGVVATHPVAELSIERNEAVYQLNTMAVTMATHDLGMMWGLMPEAGGKSKLKAVGMVFYEHDFMPGLTWVTA